MGIKPSDKNGIEPLHSPLNSIRNAQWILSSEESVQTCFAVFLRSASLRGVGDSSKPTAVVSQLARVVLYEI